MVTKKGSKRSHTISSNVNVTPIMNLFVVLIPFLLFSAVFVKIAVINISLPGISEEAQIRTSMEKTSNVIITVGVSLERLILSVSGDLNYQEEINLKKESNPLHRFHKLLVEVKKNFPDKTDIMVIPDRRVKYEMIINVLDAARALIPGDPEIFMHDKAGNKILIKNLFPDVIIGSS